MFILKEPLHQIETLIDMGQLCYSNDYPGLLKYGGGPVKLNQG
jgi:hypothetical protein